MSVNTETKYIEEKEKVSLIKKNKKSYLADSVLYISSEDNSKLTELFLKLFLMKSIEKELITYVYFIFKEISKFIKPLLNEWFNNQKDDYFHSVLFLNAMEWLIYIESIYIKNISEKGELEQVKLFLKDVIQTFENLKKDSHLDIKKEYTNSELIARCDIQLKLSNFIIIYFKRKELEMPIYYKKLIKEILINLKLASHKYKDNSSSFTLATGVIYIQLYKLNSDISYFENSLKFLHKSNILSNYEAKYQLGMIYYYGIGNIEKNLDTAYKYILDSYKTGNIRACYYLSILYYEGKIVNKNIYASKNYLLTLIRKGFKTDYIVETLQKYWIENNSDLKYYILKSNEENEEGETYLLNISFLYYYGIYKVDNIRLKKIFLLTLFANGHSETEILDKLKELIIDENDEDIKYFTKEFNEGNNKYAVFLGIIYYYVLDLEEDEELKVSKYWFEDIENSNKLSLNHLRYYLKDKPEIIELISSKSISSDLYMNENYKKEEIDFTIKFSLIIYYNILINKNRNLARKIWFKFIDKSPKCILYLKKSFCEFPEDLLNYNYMVKEKDPESIYYYGLIHKYKLTELIEPNMDKACEYWSVILKSKEYYTQEINNEKTNETKSLISPIELKKYKYFKEKASTEIQTFLGKVLW